MTHNRQTQAFLQNVVDIKPKVPSIFEPGPAYRTSQVENIEDSKLEDIEMFDHAAKRDFVVRRGRNNRIFFRPIMRNIFNESADELHKI